MKNILILILITATLAACSGEESAAKKAASEAAKTLAEVTTAVSTSLKDPDSAKFGEFTKINNKFACLGVNARNSFGGYTGEQQASLIMQEGKWFVLGVDKYSHKTCVEIMTQVANKKT